MKNHLFVTIMLATASLSSFATVEPTAADSTAVERGTIRKIWDEDKLASKPDFSAISPSGHKLYYKITSSKNNNVQVVDTYERDNAKLTGDLIVPGTVKNGSTTYNVTSIGSTAFFLIEDDRINMEDGLHSVVISEGIVNIGSYAFFKNRTLTHVELPQSLAVLDESAFEGCGIKDLVVPGEKLRIIKTYAFFSNPLVNLVIKNGVTYIEGYAFTLVENCKVQLPESIKMLEDAAMRARTSETANKELIVYMKTPCNIGYPFDDIGGHKVGYAIFPLDEFVVYVPVGCVEAYRNDEFWSKAKAILEIGTDIEESETVVESNFYSSNGILYSKQPVIYSVYDMVGRCLYAGNKKELSLPKGLYIVKTVDKAEKVMVR